MADLTFGPVITDNGVLFRLWAPLCDRVFIEIEGCPAQEMTRHDDGWFRQQMSEASTGTRYRFRLPDRLAVPDPASHHQPADVFGPSEVVDLSSFEWQSSAWRGQRWEETVLYELHVGSFTPEGTFAGVTERLDHLVELGVTAIQLMPCPGSAPMRQKWLNLEERIFGSS